MKTCKDCNTEIPENSEIKRCEPCEVKNIEKVDKRATNVIDLIFEFFKQL